MAFKGEIPPVWVRDQSSRIWGPLSLATLELMVDHGVVTKPFQYSVDGVKFQVAPDDLLVGGSPLPAALAPPVLAASSNTPSGSSAMKAAVMAGRAAGQAARAPGGVPAKAAAPGSTSLAPPPPPRVGSGPLPRATGAVPPKPAAGGPVNTVPKASVPPAAGPANRVPRATTSKPGSGPVIAPPPPGADGGMNLDAMLKDITDFKNQLPSDVLAEARRAAGLPDLNAAAPPPPPPGAARSFQAAPPHGRIEEVSGLRLFYLIAAAEAGGRLNLGEGPDEVRLWFRQGTPQAVQSSAQGLGPFLVEHRALSQTALDEALQQSDEDPVSFLFASGQLNPSAVFPLIQQHSLAILQRALLLEKGPFTFDPDQLPPPSGFPLGNRWEILVGAARRLDTLSLQRRLAGREDQAPRITGSTAELKLTALELRLVSSLDGSRSTVDLIAASPAEADALLRIAVLLQELDRLTWQNPTSTGTATGNAVPRSNTGSFRAPSAGGSATNAVPRSNTGSFRAAVAAAANAPPRPATGSFKVPAAAGTPASAVPRPGSGSVKVPAAAAAGTPKPPVTPPAPAARPAAAPPGAPAPAARPPPAAPASKASPQAGPSVAPPTAAAPARPAPPKTAPPRTSPPKTAPPRPATGPPAPVVKAEDPGTFLAALREKNFFERLGFSKSEGAPAQLKNVYFQYAKIYHPDMLAAEATPLQKKQREEILALLNEAYGTLADDARRKDYLEQLAAAEEGLDAVDIEAILRAEEDFQRAIVLIRGHKVKEGLAMIEACIKLNEKEGEFYAWRGYARFLLATDKKAAFVIAMNDVQKCLKMVTRCPPAHLIEANMAKVIGDDETAKKAFKKVLELDPNNVEATRELRLYQQRSGKK